MVLKTERGSEILKIQQTSFVHCPQRGLILCLCGLRCPHHFMPAATTRPSKRNFTESYSEIVQGLQNKTLVVTTIIVSYDHN